ncbi:MAG: hypothetical protein Q7J69_06400 [Candidatus Omnitrophota bacterium]|nr:hypothetical protein [Candidatus Omnitrophota bacterium]
MTFTLAEVLLFIIAGMLTVVAGLLVWMVVRVSEVSGEIEKGLVDLRRTVGRIDGISESCEIGVALARQVLAPSLTRFGALFSGVKRGLGVLLRGEEG